MGPRTGMSACPVFAEAASRRQARHGRFLGLAELLWKPRSHRGLFEVRTIEADIVIGVIILIS